MEVKRKASVVEKVLSEHRRHSSLADTGKMAKAVSPMKSGRFTDMDQRSKINARKGSHQIDLTPSTTRSKAKATMGQGRNGENRASSTM